MARRKKSKIGKVHHRRHRSNRMAGVKGTVMSSAGLVAGAIAGNYVKQALGDKLTVGGKDLSGVAVLALGMFGPRFVKSPMLKSVFDGMIVSGGVTTLATFVPALPINGLDAIGQVDQIGAYTVQGINDEPTIVNESYNEFSY
jgi:hypothetical protein